jgi:peptidoglycan/xylan/chitin deacetylase (PgdA/CDA1 family)
LKGKYAVIALLLAVLVWTVSVMLSFMDRPVVGTMRNLLGEITGSGIVSPWQAIPDYTMREWEALAAESESFTRVVQDQIQIQTSHRNQDLSRAETSWEPLFMKGFNLGAALPGCFPSEFKATRDQYYQWLEQMGDLEANVVRTYTILPPEFYEALKKYNFNNHNNPIYLVQGVWAYVISEGSYGDEEYIDNFHAEIRDVIDVIHGNAVIEARPGHAHGVYTANVAQYTASIILGREWEPNTVSDMGRQFPEKTSYDGIFFSVPDGHPMECWISETLDYAASYETSAYQFQHALSFVNWLPLDPMYHDSEWIEWDYVREYDNDLETIDPCRIHDSPLFKPGYFASYHAYPYYPDFVYNDPGYRQAKCSQGPCTYYGYLQDLVAAHSNLPVIIAEFGVPSSRSSSHFEPGGMNQGGHSEEEQGRINAHLIDDIYDSGAAGAILFAWIDEWFKHNWLVMEYELPRERNKLWHNLEDPEQNFGMLALESKVIVIDGKLDDWRDSNRIETDPAGDAEAGTMDVTSFWATSDASCLYLRMDFNEEITDKDWGDHTIWIGIDTYGKDKGDFSFPGLSFSAPTGLEFLLEINGPGKSRLLVDDPYDVYTDYFKQNIPGYSSLPNSDGIFHEQHLLTNRMRESLYGKTFSSVYLTRSNLLWGTADLEAQEHSSLTDISVSSDRRKLELRIPWALLNVTDPSSMSVLDDQLETDELDITTTAGFRFYPLVVRQQGAGQELVDAIPDDRQQGIQFSWDKWEIPEYTSRLKEGADLIATAFRAAVGSVNYPEPFPAEPLAELSQWPDGKDAAVSISFDDGSAYQYRYGKKLLEKYGMRGTFFVVTSWAGHSPLITGEADGLITRRLSIPEIGELHRAGHEIGSHGHEHRPMNNTVTERWIESTFTESQTLITEWTGEPAVSVAYPYSALTPAGPGILTDLGFKYGRIGGDRSNDPGRITFTKLYSQVMVDDETPDPGTLVGVFNENKDMWTILQYHHLFPGDAREYSQLVDHDVEEKYNVTPRSFERQIRLLRNRNLSVRPIREIAEYLEAYSATTLEFSEHQDNYVLTLKTDSNLNDDYPPLTLKLRTPWEWISVEGSEHDGVYHNRTGIVRFDVAPGSETIVKRLYSKRQAHHDPF